jgi:hypothetical protein
MNEGIKIYGHDLPPVQQAFSKVTVGVWPQSWVAEKKTKVSEVNHSQK